jgi:hypothetical protein
MHDQGTFAPPFDPNAHFESPYYEWGNHSWSWYKDYNSNKHGGYWNFPGFDYNPWTKSYAQVAAGNNGSLPMDPATARRLFEQANIMAMQAMAQ